MERSFRIVDRILAIAVASLAIVINVGIHRPGEMVGAMLMLSFGLIPSVLLWLSHWMSMGLLVFMSLFCCVGSYVVCDTGPSDPWGVLHIAHDWLWLVSPYALVRAIMLRIGKAG